MKKTIFCILIFIICLATSWAIVSGFIWLIFLCFGFKFNFFISTGIWLILCLINLVFKRSKTE